MTAVCFQTNISVDNEYVYIYTHKYTHTHIHIKHIFNQNKAKNML